MLLKKRNCTECGAEFLIFKYDAHEHLAKLIHCPACRCRPGRHKFTLIRRVIICTDCFLLRMPLAVAVQREMLKRRRNKGLTVK